MGKLPSALAYLCKRGRGCLTACVSHDCAALLQVADKPSREARAALNELMRSYAGSCFNPLAAATDERRIDQVRSAATGGSWQWLPRATTQRAICGCQFVVMVGEAATAAGRHVTAASTHA